MGGFDRRGFLSGIGAAGLVAVLKGQGALAQDAASFGQGACGVAAEDLKPDPQVAVSLRGLAEELSACQAGSSSKGKGFFQTRCGRAERFLGMTRLDGIVVDRANRDIVLWGLREEGAPKLHLADFVIALRAAFGNYVETRDGQTYRLSPAISLDADGSVFEKLRDVSLADAVGQERYSEICHAPMVVRVDGMPRHTRLAKLLVDADFRMKLVGFGEVVLPISDPFPAVVEARQRQDYFNSIKGRTNRPSFQAARMWFEPGEFSYQISPARDTVFLDKAQVVLRDRTQRTDAKGQLQDAGRDDAYSRAFTCAWTARMEEVYRAEPIWRDMHNIYRHFAIADILARERLFEAAGLDPAFFLRGFEPSRVDLPDTMPGYAKITKMGKETGSTHFYAVCGGVSVGFDDTTLGVSGKSTQDLGAIARRARMRPARQALAWSLL